MSAHPGRGTSRTARRRVTSTVIGLVLSAMATASAGELAALHQHQRLARTPATQEQAGATPLPRTPQGLLQLQPLPWERPVPDIARIGLERTSCLGTCPAYTVIVLADGTFTYMGSANVARIGEHSGSVPRWFLDRVLRYVDEIEFMSIDATFDAQVLDAPSAYTMVEWDGTTHVVLNAASAAPSVVWALERLIDDMLELATWE